MKTIALLHYTSPPIVGGVESVIGHQARALRAAGYPVRVISGRGAAFADAIPVIIQPLFDSMHPDVLKIKTELDNGIVSPLFVALSSQVEEHLRAALDGVDICIAHNIPTLHKHLPLTAALARIATSGDCRVLAWCHDLAWTNPLYVSELHEGEPWSLLREAWRDVTYITVSPNRRDEQAALMGLPGERIHLIEPGIDIARFMRWTAETTRLAERLHLLDAAVLLLLPARMTRRKNIELALHVLAELRQQSAQDVRLIVTGPPGAHNPQNSRYLEALLELRRQLGLEASAHFLYVDGSDEATYTPDDETVSDLYRLADALFFPSQQEGFGIPVLEAGITGLPVFCADIPSFRAIGGEYLYYFDVHNPSPEAIASQILLVLSSSAPVRLRIHVRRNYQWSRLIRDRLIPLLEADESNPTP
jgi:glycosyltransferase involved in cell wall biosynthesis